MAGAGTGKRPWAQSTMPPPTLRARAVPFVDGEGVDAGGGGDDVDDGVDCAYFVEVDFFDGDVVDLGFGGAEEFEGVDGGLFDGGAREAALMRSRMTVRERPWAWS